MSYTNGLDKSDEYFNTKLYTGNGSTQSIDGINFQPDFVITKNRSASSDHLVFDVIRGATNYIKTNASSAEATISTTLTSFDADGFSIGDNGGINTSGNNFVSWNWLAGGTASSNTDGNGNNVLVSANTTAGFSIVQGDMNASGSWTFGHGLGVAPSMIILRGQTVNSNWYVYHKSLGAGNRILLNTTDDSTSDTTFMDNTAPTTSVFSMNAGTWSAGAGTKMIAYCFAEKKGFSKFGSYTGNGSTDGTFVYTGFKPAFVILKRTTTAGNNWNMVDNKRNTFNVINNVLNPSAADVEVQANVVDFTSNGFKLRISSSGWNHSGDTFIYMAFAEHPLVSSTGVPCTAR